MKHLFTNIELWTDQGVYPGAKVQQIRRHIIGHSYYLERVSSEEATQGQGKSPEIIRRNKLQKLQRAGFLFTGVKAEK